MVSDNIDLDTPDPFAPTPPRQPEGELTLADARARLKTLGVCFTQPTPTQIKVGPINFWPKAKGWGRIHIDGCTKHPDQGWEAFIKLLQRHGLMRPSNEVQQLGIISKISQVAHWSCEPDISAGVI